MFGGFIGLLIVDPATGAVYRIDQKAVATSQAKGFNVPNADPNGLKIASIDQIPDSQRQLLVPVPTR